MDQSPPYDPQYSTDDVIAICNSLGKLDENDGIYMRDRDCQAGLKELQRYLIADIKKHSIRCTIGELNIIESDIIPIIVQYCDYDECNQDLFTISLRLATNLTTSPLVFFEGEQEPTEPEDSKLYRNLLNPLLKYKAAFATNVEIWSCLNKHLKYNSDEEIIFERIIILIRNILHIPVDSTGDFGIHDDYDAHTKCLSHMDKSGMLETIIHLASETERGNEYCLHLTEIIYLMLRDQNPETLAQTRQSATESAKDQLSKMLAIQKKEMEAKKQSIPAPRFARHSLYSVKNCRSLGENPLIVHQPFATQRAISTGKQDVKKAKNKKPLSSNDSMMFSDQNTKLTSVSQGLKRFCKEFVEKVYNEYMNQIKHNLIQRRAQENDESHYLWAVHFFTSFAINLRLDHSYITESISRSTIQLVQSSINDNLEKLQIEKKKFHIASKRLHLALRAYKQILNYVKILDKESPESIKSTKQNLLAQNILMPLFNQYVEPKYSTHYLRDLILTNFLFLELLGDKNEAEIISYCNPRVVIVHLLALKNSNHKDELVNDAVLKMFERIAFDCQNEVLLFQASIFKYLIDIVNNHPSMPCYDRYKALAQHLFEKFGSMVNRRSWMFQELLFWKTGNDIIEIENAVYPPPTPPPQSPPPQSLQPDELPPSPPQFSPPQSPQRQSSQSLPFPLHSPEPQLSPPAFTPPQSPQLESFSQCSPEQPAQSSQSQPSELESSPPHSSPPPPQPTQLSQSGPDSPESSESSEQWLQHLSPPRISPSQSPQME